MKNLNPGLGQTNHLGILFLVFLVLSGQIGWASSGWGHLGQSIYLFSIEMPGKALVFKAILGDELFAKLTNETGPGNYHFDLDNLNKFQEAFISGAVKPDNYDIDNFYLLGKGWPVHEQ